MENKNSRCTTQQICHGIGRKLLPSQKSWWAELNLTKSISILVYTQAEFCDASEGANQLK